MSNVFQRKQFRELHQQIGYAQCKVFPTKIYAISNEGLSFFLMQFESGLNLAKKFIT